MYITLINQAQGLYRKNVGLHLCGLDSTDLTALGPCTKDRGPMFFQYGPKQGWYANGLQSCGSNRAFLAELSLYFMERSVLLCVKHKKQVTIKDMHLN